jgi:uncharacterized protein YcbK (DUF882 family)
VIGRRDFCRQFGALVALAVARPEIVLAAGGSSTINQAPTVLWLQRRGESYRMNYSTPEGYQAVRYMLRDQRANVIGHPSWRLLQILSWTQAWLAGYGVATPYNVLSGLRIKSTNDATEGAALRSNHLPDENGVFRATDIHSPLVSTAYLGQLTALLKAGGVGFYLKKNFCHIDDGRARVFSG